jgi:NAD(P)-dependent dehydrogenase (short-subunit alcohol dehydrogenase family)
MYNSRGLRMNRLQNKIALITGGSTGFGYAIAELFSREGASVIIAARREERGMDAIKRIKEQTGSLAKFFKCNVTKENEVHDLVNEIILEHKKIDVLVNNAGCFVWKEFENTSEEEWNQMMDVNLKGCFLTIKNTAPLMIKASGGSIINISSIVGLVGKGYIPMYSASKGGVTLLTRSLALRYAKYNIRVNCICPGTIITDLNKDRIEKADDPGKALRDIISEYPLGRLGTPLDVAYAALYLASEESQWVTGVALPVDGGYTAGK